MGQELTNANDRYLAVNLALDIGSIEFKFPSAPRVPNVDPGSALRPSGVPVELGAMRPDSDSASSLIFTNLDCAPTHRLRRLLCS